MKRRRKRRVWRPRLVETPVVAPVPEPITRGFAPEVRARGAAVLDDGAVELLERGPDRVSALVYGTSLYTTTLERTPHGIDLECSCPFMFEHTTPCKHLWALVLAASELVDLDNWAAPEANPAARESADGSSLLNLHATSAPASRAWRDATSPAGLSRPARPTASQRFGQTATSQISSGATRWSWRGQLSHLANQLAVTGLPALSRPAGQQRLRYHIDVEATARVGRLRLGVYTQLAHATDGTFGPATPVALSFNEIAQLLDPDRELLQRLVGVGPPSGYYDGSHLRSAYGAPSRHPLVFELTPEAISALLPALAATGRLILVRASPPGESAPLVWSAEPWRFEVELAALTAQPSELTSSGPVTSIQTAASGRLEAADPAANFELRGWLRSDQGPAVALDQAWVVLPGGLVAGDGWAAPLGPAAMPWVELLRTERRAVVPASEADEWLTQVFRLPGALPHLDLPAELAVEHHHAAPQPLLRIGPPIQGHRSSQALSAALSFRYDGSEVEPSDTAGRIFDPLRRRVLERDLPREAAAVVELIAAGAQPLPPYLATAGNKPYEVAARRVPELVPRLLAAGFEVTAEGRAIRRAVDPALSVSSGIDWFEVSSRLDFGDGATAPLPALLQALAKGESTVLLDDGSRGLLPVEWLTRHRLWLELGTPQGDVLRFSPAHVPLVGGELEAASVTLDADFAKLRSRLRTAATWAVATPRGFRGTLRDYQRAGVGWLRFLATTGLGGCLADEMGLGKTVQLLAFLAARQRPADTVASLVVAPRSLLFNWAAESARFAPRLVVREHHGPNRAQTVEELAGADLVLTTYDLLRRDIELFASINWDVAILDEAQAIKNETTASARAARQLRAKVRLAATGTPVENHLGELFSLFEFLNPGLLERSTLLRSGGGLRRELPPADLERLARGLRPFILRRTKREVAPELPERTEQTVYCDLEPGQRKAYDELRDYYRLAIRSAVRQRGLGKVQIQVLEALLRLRQVACHPGLLDPARATAHSAKFDVLLPRLTELAEEGHKVLVFSQFTSLLALLRQRLAEVDLTYAYLDGSTKDRAGEVARFRDDPNCPLFLISLKAGGLGLNLVAAGYVFLLDPWWNPAVEAQAIDRSHRIGQTQPVFAYRLIARDTVEERILELQARKREVADAILGAQSGPLSRLTAEDLELLLS